MKGGDCFMKGRLLIGLIGIAMLYGGVLLAQESQQALTLEESIKIALERNLQLLSATEGVMGSQYRVKEAFTNFLPQWTGLYSYTRYSDPSTIGFSGAGGSATSGPSRDIYNFSTTLNQPLFTGGLNLSNYRFEKLGLDLSKTNVEVIKRDTVLQVRIGYFTILRALKLREVAEQTVKQFEGQLEVTKAFFEVGIVPKNDLLQAEVRLAQARQDLIKAENGVAVAKASFNILLRRDVSEPFNVVDILRHKPSTLTFEESLEEALRQRSEMKSAQLSVEQAKQSVNMARSGFFPTVSLAGNYLRLSDQVDLQGEKAGDRWSIQALATFTLWNWGNTAFKVGENKVKVSQAENAKLQVQDNITLEVKQNYLNMVQAEKNVGVAEKAIEQAEENLRMNQERYKYQVATAFDVLDAVTLLAQAGVNYYSALSDFNITKAQLDRAMERMYP
jgi:outer membrane protein